MRQPHTPHTPEERAARVARIVETHFSDEELAEYFASEDQRQADLASACYEDFYSRREYDDEMHARAVCRAR